jgi:hypothetical protein
MDLAQLLEQQKIQDMEKKAARDAQLQALAAAPKMIDTRPMAGFLDSMYGMNTTAGAQAVAEKKARDEALVQELLAERRKPETDDSTMRGLIKLEELKLKNKAQAAQQPMDLTPGQKRVDQQFADEYQDYFASGGYADVDKNVEQLEEVINRLGQEKDLTGGLASLLPKGAKDIVAPNRSEVQEAVEEVVQRNLRLILGAQFTEKEGARLIERSFNPRLSAAENQKRIRRLANQIKAARDAKSRAAEYYERNGTLKGSGFATELAKIKQQALDEDGTGSTAKKETKPAASDGLPNLDAIKAEIQRRKSQK